jgi:hypothetical protein
LPSLPALRRSWPFAGAWALRLRVRAGDVLPPGGDGGAEFVWLDLTGDEPPELLAAAVSAGADASVCVRGLPLSPPARLACDGEPGAAAQPHAGDFDLAPGEYDRWRHARARARGVAPGARAGDATAPADAAADGGAGSPWGDGDGGAGPAPAASSSAFFKGVMGAAAGAAAALQAAAAGATAAAKSAGGGGGGGGSGGGGGGWLSSLRKSVGLGGGDSAAAAPQPLTDDEVPGSAPTADARPQKPRPAAADAAGIEWRTD